MKKPLIKVPSLGTVQPLGYGVLLGMLLFAGVNLTLNFVFLITMAVPVVGAFQREPRLPWRIAAGVCVLAAFVFLLVRHLQPDSQALFFYMGEGAYGMATPAVDAINLLVVGAIFLPLSAAVAIHRIILVRRSSKSS